MDKTVILNALINVTGTDPQNARLLAEDLANMEPPFDGFLERWLENPKDLVDYEVEGISISELMSKAQLTYPAALSTLNWANSGNAEAIAYIKANI